MTTIGFIGSGKIGGTVAALAVAAGYDVVVSNSRGPETLTDLVAQLGPQARAGTSAEAAEAGEIVVLSVPFKASAQIAPEPLAGKVVVDTGNYYPQRDGVFAELEDGSATSSELVQRHFADAHVVKGFNNIWFQHLRSLPRPAGSPDRSALAIAGPDEAKAVVSAFLDRIGYDTVDVGPLSESWRTQPDTPAYGGGYGTYGDPAGEPAGPDAIKGLVEAATR
ncbi:NADPH-dependent F420 reductase [Spongisporangium articulatum]|uniref:NADPH-dependent F420 reductase n=1 Tax=Spongisporangium articulatum TaxID=3362603 RepID=A0ABW8ALG1_9ACTN